MKKILLLLVGMVISVAVLAEEKEVTIGSIVYTYDPDNIVYGVKVKDGTEVESQIVEIPATISIDNINYSVKSIADEAFKGNTNIMNVKIPEGVEALGNSAFNGCAQIKMITLPSTLTTIGSYAFSGCSRLVHVGWRLNDPKKFDPSVFPNNSYMTLYVPQDRRNDYLDSNSQWYNTTRFGDRIYEGDMLEVVNDGMTYICASISGDATLFQGKNVSEVIVPSNFYNNMEYHVKSIGRAAFYGFTSINSVKIEDGSTIICNEAFGNCLNLQFIEIPSTLKTIGSSAFSNCSNLVHIWSHISTPENLDPKNFPDNSMMTLYVPSGTETLYQASWSSKFKRIYEGDMLKVINNGMTYICATVSHKTTLFAGKNEQDVEVPSTITNNNVTYQVTGIDRQAFMNLSSIVDLTISENITAIGYRAFCNCKGLKTVKLPVSLTTINKEAFYGCSNLVRVVSKINSPFKIDNSVFNYARSLYVPCGTKETYKGVSGWNKFTFIIDGEPQEVVRDKMKYICAVGSNENVATLVEGDKTPSTSEIIIPASITDDQYNSYQVIAIDKDAFNGAPLEKLSFEDGFGNISIGDYAFQNCKKLRELNLPNELEYIGNSAFNSCSSLVHIICKDITPSSIHTSAFDSNSTKKNATLYVPANCLDNYQGCPGWDFVNIVDCEEMSEKVIDGITYVCLKKGGANTAKVIKGDLTEVTIPATINVNGESYNVYDIAENAFLSNKLVSLTISEGVRTIGASAFQNCTNLQKVVLPGSLTSIGDYAFDQCSKLAYIVTKSSSPIIINNNVFSNTEATLFVPDSKTTQYREADGWKRFSKILEGNLDEVKDGDLTYYCATSSRVALLVKSTTTQDVVSIPSTVNNTNYKVKTIENSAFSGNAYLVNLTIPEGVDTIGTSAFQKCEKLQKVVLPSSLRFIGEKAFYDCKNIKTILSGINLTDLFIINNNVFSSDIWPKADVYVPIGAAGTYQNTLGWNNFINYIEGEKLQTTVDNMTYEYLTGAKTATLIGTTVSDKDVTIPGTFKIGDDTYTVTAIENSAFKGNTSIVNLKISENIKTIGANAFQSCAYLKKIEFPSSLISIGDRAFDGCKYVTHVCSKVKEPFVFSSNVFSIYTATLFVPDGKKESYKGKDCWNKFSNVIEGYLVDVLTRDNLTYDCVRKGEGETVTTIATLTKSATTAASVSIPSSVELDKVAYKVTTIGKSAFSGNSKLVDITISENVKSIEESAFENCNNISNVVSKIQKPFAINDNVFSTSSATLYVPSGTRADYQKTDGWKKFMTVYEGEMKEETQGDMTYVYATGDKTAILVKTTTTATDVFLPDSFAVDDVYYKVIAIKEEVFKNKSSIKNLRLPSTLQKIGDNAFAGCKNIEIVTSKVKEPFAISDNVFSVYTGTLYVPEGSRSKYQNAGGWKNFTTVLEGVRDEVTLGGMTYVYATGDKTATLTMATVSDQDVIIPGSFKVGDVTYTVTAINNSVFKGNKSLVNLKISENVKTIGAYVFQNCINLKKIELPSTLTSIGEKAFDGCKAITHVCSKVKSPFAISDNVFSAYTASLYVPEGTKASYNGKDGWNKFSNVAEGYLVDVLTLSDMTYDCIKKGDGETATTTAILKKSATTTASVIIPSSVELDKVAYKVTTIGKSAFSGNSKLVDITISENVKSIEESAFENCNNISNVVSKIQKPFAINDNVFSTSSATLYVPSGTRADYQKTDGWKNFTTIYEGEKKEIILDNGMTFVYATGDKTAILTKASISDKDITIPSSIMVGEISYMVIAIDKTVFNNNKSIANLKISESIKTIGNGAFQNCINLEKIELPSTLTNIGENAFDGCTRLTYIVNKVKTPFIINDNVFSASIFPTAKLFVPSVTSADYKTTAGWQNFTHILVGELNEVTIDDLTYYCVSGANVATLVKASTSIADVTIPATIKVGDVTYNVTDIDAYAFSGVSSLEKVTISEGVLNLGIGAFQNCNKLNEVVLPSSIISIGELAFDKCSRLALVVSHIKNPFAINENVFPANTPKLNVPEGTTDLYRSAGGWTNFSLIVEGDVLEIEIGGMTYLYITGPRTATLVKGVTSLSDLTIPATIAVEGVEYAVTAIGESALVNSNSIVNLTISEGIKTIEANAFKNSQYMNKVELPSTLTVIGDNAFAKCDRLTHVVSSIKKPFDISENVFSATTFANATLYIPEKTSELYQATDYWNKFQSVLEGDILEETIDGMTYIYIPNLKIAKLTKGSTGVKEVTIPATVTIDGVEYQVTSIDRSAFYGNNSIVSLTVSEGVMNIGYTAFKNCYNLKTVSLPESMVSIADYAFQNCSRLTTVNSLAQKPIGISGNVFSVSTMTVNVPAGSADLYKADDNWGKFDIAEINCISISAANQVPYYSNYNLDFTNKPDLKAYVATGYDKSTGTIWLTRVKQVPANTGFLLIGDAGDYDIPVIDGVSDVYYKNMFKGTLEGTTIQTTDGKYTNYYLSKGTAGVGFYKVTNEAGQKIGANRCYLPILTDIQAEGSDGDVETIKVSAAKQVPYYTSKNLDFSSLDAQGVKAYTATGYNYSTGVIWLTRVKKVPAKTGILVMADKEGEYNVPTASVQSTYENMFVGSLTAQTIYTNEKIGGVDYINYYLSKGDAGVGFYKVTKEEGVKMGANRCYLPIPKRDTASGARGKNRETETFCKMIFSDESDDDVIAIPVFGGMNDEDDGTTGIEVQSSIFGDQSNDVYYNLQGQRVEHPGKGLYIKNGKKVMIK